MLTSSLIGFVIFMLVIEIILAILFWLHCQINVSTRTKYTKHAYNCTGRPTTTHTDTTPTRETRVQTHTALTVRRDREPQTPTSRSFYVQIHTQTLSPASIYRLPILLWQNRTSTGTKKMLLVFFSLSLGSILHQRRCVCVCM